MLVSPSLISHLTRTFTFDLPDLYPLLAPPLPQVARRPLLAAVRHVYLRRCVDLLAVGGYYASLVWTSSKQKKTLLLGSRSIYVLTSADRTQHKE